MRKIGIDVKWYFHGPPGCQRYVKNITDNLIALDRDNEYYLFVSREYEAEHFNSFAYPNVHTVVVKTTRMVPRIVFSLTRIIGKYELDVLFTHSYIPLSKKVIRCVTIYDTIHKDFPQYFTLPEKLYFKFIDYAIRNAECIFAISEYVKKRIQNSYNTKARRIMVTYLAANDKFCPLENESERKKVQLKYNLPDDFLLYLGRINIRKNLRTLISAVAKCEHDIPLVLVGKKDWKTDDTMFSLIQQKNLQDRIHLTGYVDDEDLPGVYSLATAFVYIPFEEGFGVPPLEAMSCGTPVISSNTSSIPEVVGDAGLLVDPRSEGEVIQALNRLLHSPELQQELRVKGLERAKLFSWEKSAQKILEFFNQI